ncbi:MAG: hypothetical protein PHW04_18315, partial [Candidatus Wallbacteria bacterium]|nr:hypothetical protein [Candidatus Wallbacteria bacterium]
MSRAAILGAKNSGKTTIFKIITGIREVKADAQVLGEMKISDRRLAKLSDMHNPKKTTYATIAVSDFRNDGNQAFAFTPQELVKCELLVFVLRLFEDQSIYYPFGDKIDPAREYQELLSEISFKDLEILDKRCEKIKLSMKCAKKNEREVMDAETALCERLKKQLEEGVDIRKTEFTEQEQGFIYYYNLISLKKRLLVLNKNDATPAGLENQTLEMLRKGETNILVFDGKLELEMSELP